MTRQWFEVRLAGGGPVVSRHDFPAQDFVGHPSYSQALIDARDSAAQAVAPAEVFLMRETRL